MTTAIKSVSVSLEFVKLAEENHISFSEAVRVGLAILLSEKGNDDFLNRTTIGRKLERISETIQDLQKKIGNYENVLEKK